MEPGVGVVLETAVVAGIAVPGVGIAAVGIVVEVEIGTAAVEAGTEVEVVS